MTANQRPFTPLLAEHHNHTSRITSERMLAIADRLKRAVEDQLLSYGDDLILAAHASGIVIIPVRVTRDAHWRFVGPQYGQRRSSCLDYHNVTPKRARSIPGTGDQRVFTSY